MSADCDHYMHARCPGCNTEMYALSVWAFSHGDGACRCGFTVKPTVVGDLDPEHLSVVCQRDRPTTPPTAPNTGEGTL